MAQPASGLNARPDRRLVADRGLGRLRDPALVRHRRRLLVVRVARSTAIRWTTTTRLRSCRCSTASWWLAPIVAAAAAAAARPPAGAAPIPAFALILIAAGARRPRLRSAARLRDRHPRLAVRLPRSRLFGPLDQRQFGMGYGGLLVCAAFLFLLTRGIAARGAINGDVFVVGSIGLIVALVAAFIFFPVTEILLSAVKDNAGAYAPASFAAKLLDRKIWGLACLYSRVSCGVAWNSLVPRRAGRRRHHAPGPRLRADRDPHRVSGQARAQGADRAADHHPALRDRARGHPPVRPLGRGHPVPRRGSSTSRPGAGSMACPGSGSRRCWPSPRSRSWC